MTVEQAAASYQSWRGSLVKKRGDGVERMRYDAHGTVMEMDRLYKELFGRKNATGGGFSQITWFSTQPRMAA